MVLALVGIGTDALGVVAVMAVALLLLLLPFWLRRKNRRFGVVVVTVAAEEFNIDAVSPSRRGTDGDDNAVPWVYVEPEEDC